jgi:hypothetical protein
MIGARVSNKHVWNAKRLWGSVALILLALFAPVVPASAVCPAGQQSCSSSYSVGEAFFGNGGNLDQASASYRAKTALGETTVGNTASTTYQAQTGFNSNRNEYLEMNITTASVNFGVLSTSSAKTGTATFNVKAYVANGYQVVNASPAPTYNGYTFATASVPTASATNTEQFGINLVANTSPATFGAAAAQIPSSSYSFGKAADNTVNSPSTARYDQTNQYMYRNGDVIAFSSKSSGETDYTISYIMNINNATPAGTYTMNHVLVATATF